MYDPFRRLIRLTRTLNAIYYGMFVVIILATILSVYFMIQTGR